MTKSKHIAEKESIQVRELKMRFVYEGEIKGEWVNGLEAWKNTFMVPAEGHKVIRLEFEAEELPPKIRVEMNSWRKN